MNLSKRGEYALRVMLDLTLAQAHGILLVPLTALADAQRIPAGFLEQILLRLRQGGFLRSTRGKKGGYSLARPADGIRVGELASFLDGPIALLPCGTPGGEKQCSCPDVARCGVRALMLQATEALSAVLDACTLGQLARQTLGAYAREGELPAILKVVAAGLGKVRPLPNAGEPEYLI